MLNIANLNQIYKFIEKIKIFTIPNLFYRIQHEIYFDSAYVRQYSYCYSFL